MMWRSHGVLNHVRRTRGRHAVREVRRLHMGSWETHVATHVRVEARRGVPGGHRRVGRLRIRNIVLFRHRCGRKHGQEQLVVLGRELFEWSNASRVIHPRPGTKTNTTVRIRAVRSPIHHGVAFHRHVDWKRSQPPMPKDTPRQRALEPSW